MEIPPIYFAPTNLNGRLILRLFVYIFVLGPLALGASDAARTIIDGSAVRAVVCAVGVVGLLLVAVVVLLFEILLRLATLCEATRPSASPIPNPQSPIPAQEPPLDAAVVDPVGVRPDTPRAALPPRITS